GGGGENFYRLPFKPPHRGRNRIRPFGGERGYVIDRGPERQQRKRDDPAPEADRGERRDIQYFSTSGSLIPDDRQQHQDKAKEPGLVEMDHVLIKHQIPAREREQRGPGRYPAVAGELAHEEKGRGERREKNDVHRLPGDINFIGEGMSLPEEQIERDAEENGVAIEIL